MHKGKKTYGPHTSKARGARKWFKHYRPDGATPLLEGAPPLPFEPEVRSFFITMEWPLGYITARYAISLEGYGYEVYAHPLPEEYARGLMACTKVPETVRNNPEMLRRFPPKKLEGLDETTLCWSPCGKTDPA